MPVPKRKRSHARQSKSRANKGYVVQSFATCTSCSAVILPHQACRECGHYKGIKVLKTKAERSATRGQDRKAKAARAKARQDAMQPAEQKEE